jgi:hypothetical protein
LLSEEFIEKDGLNDFMLGEIKVSDNFASADAIIDGVETGMSYYFNKVDSDWYFDMSSMFSAMNYLLDYGIEESGMTKDNYVLMVIENKNNTTVDSTIWIPTDLR